VEFQLCVSLSFLQTTPGSSAIHPCAEPAIIYVRGWNLLNSQFLLLQSTLRRLVLNWSRFITLAFHHRALVSASTCLSITYPTSGTVKTLGFSLFSLLFVAQEAATRPEPSSAPPSFLQLLLPARASFKKLFGKF
jgi:hypothetical protein